MEKVKKVEMSTKGKMMLTKSMLDVLIQDTELAINSTKAGKCFFKSVPELKKDLCSLKELREELREQL